MCSQQEAGSPTANRSGARLLDHLVCPPEHRLRDGEVERPSRLEVDDQLELRRLLHGEIAWLGTIEDPVHVDRRTPKDLAQIRPVRHQAPGFHVAALLEHRRDSMAPAKLQY